MNFKTKTFIIIATYNAMPWLQRCLGSIDFSKFKVVVVDNNSKDKTVAYISTCFSQIELIKEDRNIGFGQANNKGISYALNQGAEQIFLINQDAYLVKGCLESLVAFQSKNSEYGILSPIHLDGKKNKLDRNFSNFLSYDKNSKFFSDYVLNNQKKSVYEVPFVNAAGWLIHKKCLLTVGGFDPLFFHYGEDDNFCQRTLYHGFKIGVIPSTFIIHDRSDREKLIIKPFSDEYFQYKTRKLKVRYANINKKDIKFISKEINQIKKLILKALLKVQFKRVKAWITYLKHTKHNIKLIEKSYAKNQNPYPHYLDLD